MSQAPVGQRSAQRPQCRQTSSSLTMIRPVPSAPAHNAAQDLYVSTALKTGNVMVKDEDVCLHCGLCAERCPTGAWDMQKYLIDMTHAEQACRSKA